MLGEKRRVSVILTMFILGLLLGFVGAGGAGVVVALLAAVFGIPIHVALGTSLGAMVFTTLSGAYSHYQEKNIAVRCGLAVGLFGALGAFLGAKAAGLLPAGDLKWLTAGMLFFSSIILAARLFFPQRMYARAESLPAPTGARFWAAAGGVGVVAGLLSGTFGVGGTPYIQLGLLIFFGMSVQQAAGTTMLVTVPIALLGGVGYLTDGNLDLLLLAKVVAGLMTGTYIGAKFTRRLPPAVLKITLAIVPSLGGLLLLSGS